MHSIRAHALALLASVLLLAPAWVSAEVAAPADAPDTLSAAAKAALFDALAGPDGEYAAHATYSAIIEKFGKVLPYVNIRRAESRHIGALERRFEAYGLPVPADKFKGHVKAPATLLEAAKEAVQSEEKNVALYDRLLAAAKNYPDLTRVFTNLRRASQERHLPALKAALAAGGKFVAGAGPGRGRGGGGACMGGGEGRGRGGRGGGEGRGGRGGGGGCGCECGGGACGN